MSLLDLPDELLLHIVGYLSTLTDINSMTQINRQTYHALNRFLYESSIQRYKQFTLSWAAWHRSLPHVVIHLEMGTSSLDEALYAATVGCHYSIMEALIQAGANVNARMRNGFTLLHAAACVNPYPPQIQILLDNGADLNARTEGRFGGYNALHLASALGNPCIVELLLDLGMDIESITTSSKHVYVTPLTCAIRGFYEYDIDYILRHQLDFILEPYRLVGSDTAGARKAAVQLLLDRNANLDGGSVCSRPRRFFRTPPGEKLEAAYCDFHDYLPITSHTRARFL